jgi:hypothetical protein
MCPYLFHLGHCVIGSLSALPVWQTARMMHGNLRQIRRGLSFMKEPDFDIAERAAFYLGKGFH